VTSEVAADEAQLARRRAELRAEIAHEEDLARQAAQRRAAAVALVAELRAGCIRIADRASSQPPPASGPNGEG